MCGTLKALLFDLDGTLTIQDTDPIHMEIWREMISPYVPQFSEEFYKHKISGGHNQELFRKYLPAEFTDEQINEFSERKERLFREKARAEKLVEPVVGLSHFVELIKQQHPRLKRALVTNACRLNAEFMVEQLGLSDFFDLIIIGDECSNPKPFPDPYLTAMDQLGVEASEVTIFEDSKSGITAAKNSNAKRIIGLMTSLDEQTLIDLGATFAIPDYRQISLEKISQ